ncbi:BTB/POZ domain-containing protein [Aspergillus puulaauensis]|uniref:BTB domain-containing protein n=1 Tax=Aspergillus puulaauensis TaxID=1220207 RepID=A0A7R8ASX3_9EURO|nr:uncharacterized protein APUU_61228A [Aspergillus puulaauensis]BCS28180.1 hypothetical protein APUU_61228A [Aspergillus puulaauensis]
MSEGPVELSAHTGTYHLTAPGTVSPQLPTNNQQPTTTTTTISVPPPGFTAERTDKMAKEHDLPYFSFLNSPTVSLKAAEHGRPFQIHRDLLASKSKTIASAFDRGFGEGQKGLYTFQDTSEGTLARFIEWAYTADYPAIIKPTEADEQTTIKPESAQTNGIKDDSTDDPDEKTVAPTTTSGPNLTQENHPLLSHIRLYIFCSIYVIPDLQKLAFDRATTAFTELNEPTTLDTQLAVIAAMRVSFRKLLPSDQLLDWLAQYAAYNVYNLRVQRGFHDLLQESSTLSSRMVLSLRAASTPPWKAEPPKYEFVHYAPDYHYDDGYD